MIKKDTFQETHEKFLGIVTTFEQESQTLKKLPNNINHLGENHLKLLGEEISSKFHFKIGFENQPPTFEEQVEKVLKGITDNLSCRMPTLVMAELLKRKYGANLCVEIRHANDKGIRKYIHPTLRIFKIVGNNLIDAGFSINFSVKDEIPQFYITRINYSSQTAALLDSNGSSYEGTIARIDQEIALWMCLAEIVKLTIQNSK